MDRLIAPHGGRLNSLLLVGKELAKERTRAATLPRIEMTSRETSDLIMMAMGAFSPLPGFMTKGDYLNVLREMHLCNGTFWPIPITLSVNREKADSLKEGEDVALFDGESHEIMGAMTVREKFTYDKEVEARSVFRTTDRSHPGVEKLFQQGEVLIGGPVRAFSEGDYPERFGAYFARPEETRRLFAERGWSHVAAFQLRNPMHRSHEYCTKIALEVSDGLFIPWLGP
jgi:sulfate adenylyltransferase